MDYWKNLIGMDVVEEGSDSAVFAFGSKQARLEIKSFGGKVEHAEAYGRIAFAVPTEQLAPLQAEIEKNGKTVLTKLVCLDTPGKASVSVVILADPVRLKLRIIHCLENIDPESIFQISSSHAVLTKT